MMGVRGGCMCEYIEYIKKGGGWPEELLFTA